MVRIKAQMVSSTFIKIVLVLIGFGILMFLFYQIGFTGRVDKEACHQSVITRAAFPKEGNIDKYIPLKCKTSKYCITPKYFGTCEEYSESDEVGRVRVDDKKEIEKFLAREVVDCWSMMGEGKVSLFSDYWNDKFGIGNSYPTCVICSRIAFDSEGFKDEFGEDYLETVLNINVYNYMLTHKMPNSEATYVEYLNDGKSSSHILPDKINIPILEEENKELVKKGEESYEIEPAPLSTPDQNDDQLAVLFMQISAPEHGAVFKNTFSGAGKLGLASFLLFPLTATAGASAAIASPTTIAAGTLLAIVGVSYQQYNVARNRGITAGYCGEVSVGKNAREGCSITTLTNYNVDSIKSFCAAIESIP